MTNDSETHLLLSLQNSDHDHVRATELNLLPSRHLLNGLESGDEVEEYNVNDLGITE